MSNELIRLAHQVTVKLLRDSRITMRDQAAIELVNWVSSHPTQVRESYKDTRIAHKDCEICKPGASGTGSNS